MIRIGITGATGMIGTALTSFLLDKGYHVVAITRRYSSNQLNVSTIAWDPMLGYMDADKLEGLDIVIHLAGANVGARWTPAHKKDILESRVQGTHLLCQTLAKLKRKPKMLLSASAVGYYGSRYPMDLCDESTPLGQGFLADVCRQWEDETLIAQQAGIQVVRMRFGVVLSKKGGALAQMWMPFNLGLGGVLGFGEQVISWVALDEIPYIVDHIMNNELTSGVVNVVSPQPVSNALFTRALGQVMKRPTVLPVPAFAVKMFFGEMGERMLLEGAYVLPRRLQTTGYRFRFADIRTALEEVTR